MAKLFNAIIFPIKLGFLFTLGLFVVVALEKVKFAQRFIEPYTLLVVGNSNLTMAFFN
jgi:hypothetical protein